MNWLDKIAKKRLEELEAHPELNSDKFAEKMSTLYFAIVLLIVAILILLFWYDTDHFEIWIFPGRLKIATIVAIIT